MSAPPLTVDIWSDIACPWCYIGNQTLGQAIEKYEGDVTVRYHSFELALDTPVDFDGSETDFLVDYKGMPYEQVQQWRAHVTATGASAGVQLDFDAVRHTNTLRAHQALHHAAEHGTVNGVVHDKLYLPGLLKLRRLIDSGFFGEILSVRGEFGYWVYEGDWQTAQRPSWNYRSEDGGGIVADMFPHWNYVIEELFGRIEDVYAQTATHIGRRWDEKGQEYTATADDAAYGVFRLEGGTVVQMNSSWDVRVHRDELVEFQVDGTKGSAVVGLHGARIQPREATPKPVWNPDVKDGHD